MSAEYLAAKEVALDQLRASCASNLKRLQENGVNAAFSFVDHWGMRKQDKSLHPQIPVLNQLSRMFLNFHVRTKVQYSYNDGNLSAELFQDLRGGWEETSSVQVHESVEVEDIPFNKFSENDLLRAAKTIEAHLQPTPMHV